jgi:hypothetical protein
MMIERLNHSYTELSKAVQRFLPEGLHHKQYQSITQAVVGILQSGSLRLSTIGRGLASYQHSQAKHGIKQVDRLLSNSKIDVAQIQQHLLKSLGYRERLLLAMDWTSFHGDGHMVLTLRHVTAHGRALPLLWCTVSLDKLKGQKVIYENQLLSELKAHLADGVQVILLADREFGSVERFERLKQVYGFDYIIRFKRSTYIQSPHGKVRKAQDWLKYQKTKSFKQGRLTLKQYPVPKILVCQEPGMKELWYIACSQPWSNRTIKNYYAKRWATETSYRDEKNLAFGWGMKHTHIKSLGRRDKLLMLSAIAMFIASIMGKIHEQQRDDKKLRANTIKHRRTHSLFYQGNYIIKLLLNKNIPKLQRL